MAKCKWILQIPQNNTFHLSSWDCALLEVIKQHELFKSFLMVELVSPARMRRGDLLNTRHGGTFSRRRALRVEKSQDDRFIGTHFLSAFSWEPERDTRMDPRSRFIHQSLGWLSQTPVACLHSQTSSLQISVALLSELTLSRSPLCVVLLSPSSSFVAAGHVFGSSELAKLSTTMLRFMSIFRFSSRAQETCVSLL